MAPTQTGVTDADMGTILNALASCEELSLNSKKFAESEGISRADNAVTKFKRVLKNHGYKFENKKVQKMDGDFLGEKNAAETPKKTAMTKKATPKATPTPKKRKMEEAADEEEVKSENADEQRT